MHAFYEGVAADPELRALYPEEDLAPAERRLRMFLDPVLRRPDHLQRGARPPPAADAARALPGDPRHARPVDAAHARRDGHPRPAEAQAEQMRDYFLRAAHMLVNTDEAQPARPARRCARCPEA